MAAGYQREESESEQMSVLKEEKEETAATSSAAKLWAVFDAGTRAPGTPVTKGRGKQGDGHKSIKRPSQYEDYFVNWPCSSHRLAYQHTHQHVKPPCQIASLLRHPVM